MPFTGSTIAATLPSFLEKYTTRAEYDDVGIGAVEKNALF